MTVSQITRDNHYVPRALLRRWSRDERTIYARQLLVPDARVPEWTKKSIREVAKQRDLYTLAVTGEDSDEFERWITTEFEEPGNSASERVVAGERLSRDEWHALARYWAVQDLRTPQTFSYLLSQWQKTLPSIIEKTLAESVEKWTAYKEMGVVPPQENFAPEYKDILNVAISSEGKSEEGHSELRVEVPLGRRLWLADMRHLLKGVAERLTRHRWTIVEPFGDVEWPLTDHPALKLWFTNEKNYTFTGGWGKPHCELMLPLSPRHLLFCHVGKDSGRRMTFSKDLTELCRRLLVEHAHRWIFASIPDDEITNLRRRHVSAVDYDFEQRQWQQWHSEQSKSESGMS